MRGFAFRLEFLGGPAGDQAPVIGDELAQADRRDCKLILLYDRILRLVGHAALRGHTVKYGIGRPLDVLQQLDRLAQSAQIHNGRLAWH